MRRIQLAVLILSLGMNGHSQDIINFSQVASSEYNPLKISLSIGNQSQMLYDGSVRKNVRKELDVADLQYYNGKYGNAVSHYTLALDPFPFRVPSEDEIQKLFGARSFLSMVFLYDVDKMSDDHLKLYSGAMNTIGLLFQTRGKFVHAEKVLKYNLDLRAARFGKTSREYINSLHNLAVLKKDIGQYEEAERIFNYLVPTLKKIYTTNSIQYVAVVNNKAMLLAELGRTSEAIALLDEALKIGETVLSPDYFDYERILTNRALIEQESSDLGNAEVMYKKILLNLEKKGFEDHPDYNTVLVNYGALLVQKMDTTILPFLTELSSKVEHRYHEHPLTAKAMTNIGNFYNSTGDYTKALAVFQRVGAMQLTLLGENHKDYLQTLINMSVCYWQLNNATAATKHFKQAVDRYLFLLNTLFPSMSESEKSKFWLSLQKNVDTYTAFVFDKNQTELFDEMYTLRLRTKGLLLNSINRTKESILRSNDLNVQQLYAQWLDVKNLLSIYYNASIEDLKDDKISLNELEQKANALEKKLSVTSAAFDASFLQKEYSSTEVANSLQPTEAAVEMIRIYYSYGNRKGDVEYIGLVAKRGSALPEVVRMPNGKLMETRYAAFYKNSIKMKTADPLSYKNYWAPVEAVLTNFKTVYVSVDGVYNNINLNTLKKENSNFVLDERNVVLITNSKVIVDGITSEVALEHGNMALLMGAPEYGNPEVLQPLPGTKAEIESIGGLLTTNRIHNTVLIGKDASEDKLKASEHPGLMHIATHGYFLSDVDLSQGYGAGVQVSKAKDNPLLRSGLMLQGAANVFSNSPVLNTSNNGVLTAYEVMNLNLTETDLVVMSACETGNGEIVNGEGVYGLSRAFQIAGAKKIIMSLWKVDDDATMQLMIAFYTQWIISKNPQAAFIEAQRVVKSKFPEPYYWGAFILLN